MKDQSLSGIHYSNQVVKPQVGKLTCVSEFQYQHGVLGVLVFVLPED